MFESILVYLQGQDWLLSNILIIYCNIDHRRLIITASFRRELGEVRAGKWASLLQNVQHIASSLDFTSENNNFFFANYISQQPLPER